MNLKIPHKLKVKKKYINYSEDELVSFETEIAKQYNGGKIRGPIHLSKGNEKQLMKIFKYIDKNHKSII